MPRTGEGRRARRARRRRETEARRAYEQRRAQFEGRAPREQQPIVIPERGALRSPFATEGAAPARAPLPDVRGAERRRRRQRDADRSWLKGLNPFQRMVATFAGVRADSAGNIEDNFDFSSGSLSRTTGREAAVKNIESAYGPARFAAGFIPPADLGASVAESQASGSVLPIALSLTNFIPGGGAAKPWLSKLKKGKWVILNATNPSNTNIARAVNERAHKELGDWVRQNFPDRWMATRGSEGAGKPVDEGFLIWLDPKNKDEMGYLQAIQARKLKQSSMMTSDGLVDFASNTVMPIKTLRASRSGDPYFTQIVDNSGEQVASFGADLGRGRASRPITTTPATGPLTQETESLRDMAFESARAAPTEAEMVAGPALRIGGRMYSGAPGQHHIHPLAQAEEALIDKRVPKGRRGRFDPYYRALREVTPDAEGFIISPSGRFATREEADVIARRAGQVEPDAEPALGESDLHAHMLTGRMPPAIDPKSRETPLSILGDLNNLILGDRLPTSPFGRLSKLFGRQTRTTRGAAVDPESRRQMALEGVQYFRPGMNKQEWLDIITRDNTALRRQLVADPTLGDDLFNQASAYREFGESLRGLDTPDGIKAMAASADPLYRQWYRGWRGAMQKYFPGISGELLTRFKFLSAQKSPKAESKQGLKALRFFQTLSPADRDLLQRAAIDPSMRTVRRARERSQLRDIQRRLQRATGTTMPRAGALIDAFIDRAYIGTAGRKVGGYELASRGYSQTGALDRHVIEAYTGRHGDAAKLSPIEYEILAHRIEQDARAMGMDYDEFQAMLWGGKTKYSPGFAEPGGVPEEWMGYHLATDPELGEHFAKSVPETRGLQQAARERLNAPLQQPGKRLLDEDGSAGGGTPARTPTGPRIFGPGSERGAIGRRPPNVSPQQWNFIEALVQLKGPEGQAILDEMSNRMNSWRDASYLIDRLKKLPNAAGAGRIAGSITPDPTGEIAATRRMLEKHAVPPGPPPAKRPGFAVYMKYTPKGHWYLQSMGEDIRRQYALADKWLDLQRGVPTTANAEVRVVALDDIPSGDTGDLYNAQREIGPAVARPETPVLPFFRNPLDESGKIGGRRTLIRIEGPRGEGPYQGDSAPANYLYYGNEDRQPMPSYDIENSAHKLYGDTFGRFQRFAFRDVDQMRRWFTDEDLAYLADNGYFAQPYEVERHAYDKSQALFDIRDAKRGAATPLTPQADPMLSSPSELLIPPSSIPTVEPRMFQGSARRRARRNPNQTDLFDATGLLGITEGPDVVVPTLLGLTGLSAGALYTAGKLGWLTPSPGPTER